MVEDGGGLQVHADVNVEVGVPVRKGLASSSSYKKIVHILSDIQKLIERLSMAAQHLLLGLSPLGTHACVRL